MSFKHRLCLALMATLITLSASASDCQIVPFQKIYVTPCDILSTPDGIFYISPSGEQIQVSTMSTDCTGNYVIITTRQCKQCGRIFKGPESSSEGYNCTFD